MALKITVLAWHFVALILWNRVIYRYAGVKGSMAFLILSACAPPGIIRLQMAAIGTHSTADLPLALLAFCLMKFSDCGYSKCGKLWLLMAGLSAGFGFWCTYLTMPAALALIIAAVIVEKNRMLELKLISIFTVGVLIGLIPWIVITLPSQGIGVPAQEITSPIQGMEKLKAVPLKALNLLTIDVKNMMKMPPGFLWQFAELIISVLVIIMPLVIFVHKVKESDEAGESIQSEPSFLKIAPLLWLIMTIFLIAFSKLDAEPEYSGGNFSSHRYLFMLFTAGIISASFYIGKVSSNMGRNAAFSRIIIVISALSLGGILADTRPHISCEIMDKPAVSFSRLPFILEQYEFMNLEEQRKVYDSLSLRGRNEALSVIGARTLPERNKNKTAIPFQLRLDKNESEKFARVFNKHFLPSAGWTTVNPYVHLRLRRAFKDRFKVKLPSGPDDLKKSLRMASNEQEAFQAGMMAGWLPLRALKGQNWSAWSDFTHAKAAGAGYSEGWKSGIMESELVYLSTISEELAFESGLLWIIMTAEYFADKEVEELEPLNNSNDEYMNLYEAFSRKVSNREFVEEGIESGIIKMSSFGGLVHLFR